MNDHRSDRPLRDDKGSAIDARKGFFVGCLTHLLGSCVLLFVFTLSQLGPVVIACIGIMQLFYMIPAVLVARAKGVSPDFMKGFLLTGVIVFILNAACFGLVALSVASSGPWFG